MPGTWGSLAALLPLFFLPDAIYPWAVATGAILATLACAPLARILGVAMQLTNICRDIAEDWDRGRLYLPDELLASHGAPGLAGDLGRPPPRGAIAPPAAAVRELLALANRPYRAADRGIPALPWRAGLAVRAARSVYAAIGAHRLVYIGEARPSFGWTANPSSSSDAHSISLPCSSSARASSGSGALIASPPPARPRLGLRRTA